MVGVDHNPGPGYLLAAIEVGLNTDCIRYILLPLAVAKIMIETITLHA